MATQVSIANLALSWLGTKGITNFSDDTVEASAVRLNYEDAIKAVLEDRNWTFAIERMILTPEEATPIFGYGHQFTIPARVRRVVSVTLEGVGDVTTLENRSGANDEIDWQKEKNKILANEDKIFVRAVVDEDDPARYPSAFVHALAARLAADMAITLTHSKELQADNWGLYQAKLTAASSSDGRQGRRERLDAPRLTRARRLGYPL